MKSKKQVKQKEYSRYGSEQLNQNRKVTTITPPLEFMILCPYQRSTDKWDEERTLLCYVEENPKYKEDPTIQELIKKIRLTSRNMERLLLLIDNVGDPVKKAQYQKEFIANRDLNYEAIDHAAVKVFGDCGLGGNFGDEVGQRIVVDMFQQTLRRLPITRFSYN